MGKTTTIGSVEFERYIQSAFRLQSGDTIVYVDPHRLDGGPPAALILITHEHFDHMDPNAIAAVATDDTVIVANAPCARQLQGKVKGRVVPVQEGDMVTEKDVEGRAVAMRSVYSRVEPSGRVPCAGTESPKLIPGDSDLVP